jgi:hypothetical protein
VLNSDVLESSDVSPTLFLVSSGNPVQVRTLSLLSTEVSVFVLFVVVKKVNRVPEFSTESNSSAYVALSPIFVLKQ